MYERTLYVTNADYTDYTGYRVAFIIWKKILTFSVLVSWEYI